MAEAVLLRSMPGQKKGTLSERGDLPVQVSFFNSAGSR